jgi:hypothetical protein
LFLPGKDQIQLDLSLLFHFFTFFSHYLEMTMLTRFILLTIISIQTILADYCDIYQIDFLPEDISNNSESQSSLEPQWVCEKSDEAKSYFVTSEDFSILNVQNPLSGKIRLKYQEKETPQSLTVVTEENATSIPSISTAEPLFLSQVTDIETISVESLETSNRRLALRTGERSVLIVRASDIHDNSPTRTASQLALDWFGMTGSNAISPKTVLKNCSAGKLILINAGIVEVTVSIDFNGQPSSTIENAVRDQMFSTMGANFESNYDHIVYILPSAVDFGGAAAYAYLNGKRTIFSDLNGSYPEVQVHELGHNYNFHHSGKISSYDDPTCLMGNSGGSGWDFERGQMCFNAAKSYHSDWYNDRRTSFDAVLNPFEGTLWGVANYPNDGIPNGDYVTVQIRGPSRIFYMTFNRQAGINSDTIDGKNQVTIVSTVDTSINVESKLEAMLNDDEKFVYSDFTDGKALVIEVCRIFSNERAQVITYVQDITYTSCAPTVSPSPTISSVPTFGCTGDESLITLEILTDLFPAETSWKIKNESGAIIYYGPTVAMLPETFYTFDYCLQHGDKYEVIIYDTFGDGMQFNGVQGYYKVMKDHVQIVNNVDNGTDFGRMAVVEIDLSFSTNRPTQLPSKIPSVLPTPTPSSAPRTPLPTMSPNGNPSSSPSYRSSSHPSKSVNPSKNPSMAPASVPSESPSRSVSPTLIPTHAPSISPTHMPTIYSTFHPSGVPTMPPVQSPTRMPTIQPTMAPSANPSMKLTIMPTDIPSHDPNHLTTFCKTDESLITLEILTDDYPAETSWVVERKSGAVIDSSDPLTDRQTLHTYDFCLQHGDKYEVIVYDAYGDGLRFAGVQGYYKVMKDDVQITNGVDNGTDFGQMAVVEIDLSFSTNHPTESPVQNHCLVIRRRRKCRRTPGCSWSRGRCS